MRRWVGIVSAALVLSFAGSAEAKDLTGRVGVGYTQTIGSAFGLGGFSGVSARYWVNEQLGFEGNLAMDLESPKGGDASNNYALGANGFYSFIDEPNLHVYGTAGLAFGSIGIPTTGAGGTTVTNETMLGFQAGMGMEFFLVGLPNLGFDTHVGLQYVSVNDAGSVIQLGGGDFATFGIRYYFGGPKGPPK